MALNFSELRDTLTELGGHDDSDFVNMTNRAINRVMHRLLSEVNQDEVSFESSLVTVASTAKYGMPADVSRVVNVEDTSNARRLNEMSKDEFDRRYPGTTTSGQPRGYYVLGTRAVEKNLAAAGTITVESSSASDATNFSVRIEGKNANRVILSEKLTMNGTTAVTSSHSYATDGILTISKSANAGSTWTGFVTVKDSSGNVIAYLAQPTDISRYLWVEFYPIPDSILTLTVRAVERVPDLVNDEDVPRLHEDWHHMIILGAGPELMLAAGKTSQAQRMLGEFQDNLARFKARAQYRPNRLAMFADVQSQAGLLPGDRPLIQNVDFV